MRTTTPNRRWSSSLAVAVAAATLMTALPSVAQADELTLIDTVEDIGPGISLRHLKAVDEGGWYDARFLTIDLSEDAVSTDLLTAGPVASAGPLSTAANRAGAVAGVNGEFFDISNSNAALGGEVQDGVLRKSADIGGREHVGVSSDGIAQLVDLAVDASADLAGATHDVLSVNAANGGGVPTNGMVAYTPVWGEYSRNRGFTGVAADRIAEVVVEDGAVVSVAQTGPAGSGPLPEGGFALVGRDGAADALRALRPGDPVSLGYELADDAARSMEFALGHGGTIVSDGEVVGGLPTSIAPRTALGFSDGGRTLVLATWDGPGGTGKGGVGVDKAARDLVRIGVETAVNLDGGGSTTMVARALGDQDATLRNVPSDGHERNDPNGVGVFVAPGDGRLHDLLLAPAPGTASADDDVNVFPGLHRTLVAKGVDDHETPVAVDPLSVRWDARGASVDGGVLEAPQKARGEITVSARSGREREAVDVQVLGPVDDVELSTERLSIAEAAPSSAVTVAVTGRDGQGFTAPIEAGDLKLDYDHSVVRVEPAAAGGLRITPLTNAATILTVSVAGQAVQLPITIGVENVTVYDFDDDVLARWRNNSTRPTTFSADPDGLRVDFEGMRNVGISTASAAVRVPVPGQPLRLRMRLRSSIAVPSGLTYIAYVDATGKSGGVYGTGLTASDDWQQATFTLPATTAYPISVSGFQGINTNAAQQKPGTFVLDRIEADVPTSIELPPRPDLEPDPLISADGAGARRTRHVELRHAVGRPVHRRQHRPDPGRHHGAAHDPRHGAGPRGPQRRHHRPRPAAGHRPGPPGAGGRRVRSGPGRRGAAVGQHARPERRDRAVLLRAGQPRVVRPEQHAGDARPVCRRVRAALPDVRPQGHAFCAAGQLVRHAARHGLGPAPDAAAGAGRRRARPVGGQRRRLRPPPGGRPGRHRRQPAR